MKSWLWFTLLACVSCGTSTSTSTDTAADSLTGTDATADVPPVAMRGKRYCEVLLGTIGDTIHIDVYTTEALNECPQELWAKLDTAALKTEYAVDLVVLNGPRYWMLDSLSGSALQDTTVHTFGGIDMRKGGALELPPADLAAMSKPYTQHTIHRESHFTFSAGKTVYELTAPDGHVYDMQSYSVQKQPLTEAGLADLASKLALPTGWTFHTRILDADLVLQAPATTGAIVVQDDLGNTYSLSK